MGQRDYPELRGLFDKHREVVKMLKGEKQLSDRQLYFSAVYSKLGKKISESRDKTSLTAFTTVITGRYQVCQPDSITITWHRAENDEKLFEHTFSIHRPSREDMERSMVPEISTMKPGGFNGLGELEVNNIVEKRLTEMRMKEEHERLREDNQRMQLKIAELEGRNADLEQDIAAKETTENYMRILGMALPGLSRFFGGAGLISLLAGTEEPQSPVQTIAGANEHKAEGPAEPKDERSEMINLLTEYMSEELSLQEVASLYLMFMEIQKDKSRIQTLLQYITHSKTTQDETTTPGYRKANTAAAQPS